MFFSEATESRARPAAAGAIPHDTLRRRHLHEMRAAMPAAIARLSWSAEQLARERTLRLRQLLHIAKEHSAWHRRRLRHVDASTFDESRLAEIAPMTKNELMTHFNDISTDPLVTREAAEAHVAGLQSDAYLHGRYHVNASGGASGRRGLLVHDWQGWTEGYIGFTRHLARHLARPGAQRPAPFVGALVAAHDPTHMSCALPQTFSDPALAVWHRFAAVLPLNEIVDGLNGVQPEVLGGYASMLNQLAVCARHGHLRIAPRVVVSTSEPLLPEMRASISAAWASAPLLNFWAATEAAPLAVSCGRSPGMHLSDDLLIVEPVDRHGRRVAAGERSAKIYLTNLYNPTPLPLIRYEISDQVVLLEEPCGCGSAHRRIDDIGGRLEDEFLYPGGLRVHPMLFATHLRRERHVVEYQVQQTARGAALALVCSGTVDLPRLRDAIALDLRRLGLADPEIALTTVQQINRQRSGKLKRFVALSGAPTH
jgi:phenylacetate-coenzyme A ligase PaaK-like adenylate-forming protein